MSEHWMMTYKGVRFDLENPEPSMVGIYDIAHALSMKVRFNGHCSDFYTVAQHSVLVSDMCSPKNALWGLLHDAAEMIICDNDKGIICLSQLVDSGLYLSNFFVVVVIIIGLISASLAEPFILVSPVHPQVSCFADGALLQIKRVPGGGIVQIAYGNPKLL